MSIGTILDILKESAIITLVITALMLGIEALNFLLKGKMMQWFRKTSFGQVASSTILGVLPGCAGGYLSVSMYSRGMYSFGALFAMMVATTGDEAFLMLTLFPKKAVAIFGILTVIAVTGGLAADFISRKRRGSESYFDAGTVTPTEESHGGMKERILHILPHAAKVFLWTFGVLLTVGFVEQYVDIGQWVKNNTAVSIVIAILIGIIPQSGPHMAFVTMFADGLLPFSVLLANCLVQEGHAGLPLLSVSKSAWLKGKLIKTILAAAISALLAVAGL